MPGFSASLTYRFKDSDGIPIHKTVHYFLGKADRQKATLSHEHQGYEWLSYDEAIKRITYKNARSILQEAEAFLINATEG